MDCSWCGVAVDDESGFRAVESEGERRAVFCRLEHVVPWVIQGAHWDVGTFPVPPDVSTTCAHCGEETGERRIVLIRHRGEYRIGDALCGPEHLRAWAQAGGRWR